jgi:hypothetical protein
METISSEFLYREVPVSYDGTGTIVDIKGNTISFNQLARNGNFADATEWAGTRGTISVSNNVLSYTLTELGNGQLQNRIVQVNILLNTHKYYISVDVKAPYNNTISASPGDSENAILLGQPTPNTWTKLSGIMNKTSTRIHLFIGFNASTNYAINDVVQFRNCMVFDLTLMGIDNLTTTTEVESWLSSHLGNIPYFGYTQGSLISFNGTGLKTTGTNLLNGISFVQGAIGAISLQGEAYDSLWTSSNTRIRISDVLLLETGETYTIDFDSTKYDCVAQPFDSNKLTVYPFDSSSYAVWKSSSFSIVSYGGIALAFRFKDQSNITPSEIDNIKPNLYLTSSENTLSLPISTHFPTGMKSAGNNGSTKIYGIKRELANSSSVWTRTDDGIGKTANATHDGTSVTNDFDSIYPWSAIKTVNMADNGTVNAVIGDSSFKFDGTNGEVMTYIPPFWYKRWQDSTYEYIQISQSEFSGASYSPRFFIGRYTTSSGAHSKSGVASQVSTNIATFRTQATGKGTGWQQLDYHYFLLQLLYLVEYADGNSQSKLGQGVCSVSAQVNSGALDSLGMKSGCLANAGATSVIYRGIENIFGNIWQFVDGLNIKDNVAYICYKPSSYQVDKFDGDYSAVGYTNANSNGNPNKMGYDSNNPMVALPVVVGTSVYGDYYWQNTGNRIARVGGNWDSGARDGLFSWSLDSGSDFSYMSIGSRLIYNESLSSNINAYDELTQTKATTRVGTRSYKFGDEDESFLTTDKTNTYYALSTPTETDISPSLDLTYPIENGGTEQIIPVNSSVPTTSPIICDIDYRTMIPVNATVDPTGSGTISGTGDYRYHSNATLTATPSDEIYRFLRWEDENGTTLSTNSTYTFEVGE